MSISNPCDFAAPVHGFVRHPLGTRCHPSKRNRATISATSATAQIAATKQIAEVREPRRLRKSSGIKKTPVVSAIAGATARTMSESAEGNKLTMIKPATKGIAMRTPAWLCRRVQVRKMAFAFFTVCTSDISIALPVQLAIGSGFLGWKQPWQPTLGKRGGKGQAKWGSRTLRCHDAALDEFRCQAAGGAITRAQHSFDVSPWQLATKQDRFQHCAGSWRQPITPRFFIGPA